MMVAVRRREREKEERREAAASNSSVLHASTDGLPFAFRSPSCLARFCPLIPLLALAAFAAFLALEMADFCALPPPMVERAEWKRETRFDGGQKRTEGASASASAD